MKKYKVTLEKQEREELHGLIKKGKRKAQTIRNALILLNCDEGEYGKKVNNEDVSKILNIGMRTIDRVKKLFVEEGFEAVVYGKMRERKQAHNRIIDGDIEAHLIALSCSDPPDGYSRWSLRLLADRMVELRYVENISYETVRRTLKKTS